MFTTSKPSQIAPFGKRARQPLALAMPVTEEPSTEDYRLWSGFQSAGSKMVTAYRVKHALGCYAGLQARS